MADDEAITGAVDPGTGCDPILRRGGVLPEAAELEAKEIVGDADRGPEEMPPEDAGREF